MSTLKRKNSFFHIFILKHHAHRMMRNKRTRGLKEVRIHTDEELKKRSFLIVKRITFDDVSKQDKSYERCMICGNACEIKHEYFNEKTRIRTYHYWDICETWKEIPVRFDVIPFPSHEKKAGEKKKRIELLEL